jgi:hypothetical protein
MDLQFSGEVWLWRGPARHHVLSVPYELGDPVCVGLTIDV